MTETLPHTDADILTRIIDPAGNALSRSAAESFLELDFSVADKRRLKELAALAREGDLSEADRAAIDSYGRISSFLTILKSKARRSLKKPSAGRNRTQKPT